MAIDAKEYLKVCVNEELPVFLEFKTKLFKDMNEFISELAVTLEQVKFYENLTDEIRLTEQYGEYEQNCLKVSLYSKNAKHSMELVDRLTREKHVVEVLLASMYSRTSLADMLNVSIKNLVRRDELIGLEVKCKNPKFLTMLKSQGFRPDVHLLRICNILMNSILVANSVKLQELLIKEIVNSRIYNLGNFLKAKEILVFLRENDSYFAEVKQIGVDPDNFSVALDKIREFAKSGEDDYENEILDLAPGKYVCPIGAVLMDDPVRLPSSGVIVNRDSILTQLQGGNKIDPFNRQFLEVSDLVDETQMKTEISDWESLTLDKLKLK